MRESVRPVRSRGETPLLGICANVLLASMESSANTVRLVNIWTKNACISLCVTFVLVLFLHVFFLLGCCLNTCVVSSCFCLFQYLQSTWCDSSTNIFLWFLDQANSHKCYPIEHTRHKKLILGQGLLAYWRTLLLWACPSNRPCIAPLLQRIADLSHRVWIMHSSPHQGKYATSIQSTNEAYRYICIGDLNFLHSLCLLSGRGLYLMQRCHNR